MGGGSRKGIVHVSGDAIVWIKEDPGYDVWSIDPQMTWSCYLVLIGVFPPDKRELCYEALAHQVLASRNNTGLTVEQYRSIKDLYRSHCIQRGLIPPPACAQEPANEDDAFFGVLALAHMWNAVERAVLILDNIIQTLDSLEHSPRSSTLIQGPPGATAAETPRPTIPFFLACITEPGWISSRTNRDTP